MMETPTQRKARIAREEAAILAAAPVQRLAAETPEQIRDRRRQERDAEDSEHEDECRREGYHGARAMGASVSEALDTGNLRASQRPWRR